MKKILTFVVLCIATFQLINAQTHEIEVIGTGVLGEDNPILTYDPTDVVKVEVEAIYFNADAITPDPVSFNGQEVSYSDVDIHYSVGADTYANEKGYYRAELTALPDDGKVELNKNSQGNSIVSFYIYVYRNRDALPYSLINPESEIAFLHAKGDGEFSVEAEFSLEAATELRDLTVTVPISDNEHKIADDRIGVIKLRDNGNVLETLTFALNTGLDNFYLQTVEVSNVQPEVEDVTVEIYSPTPKGTGDSFFAGTILLDVEEYSGCTHTQGYWKTHSEYGPAPYDDTWAMLSDGANTDFYKSGHTWYEVFWTPVRGGVYYQLAHQYMAARLSELSGASVPANVQAAMADAVELFNNPEDLSKEYVYLAELLDDYNNGIIGPGHCDDEEMEVEEEDDEQENIAHNQGVSKGKGKAKGKNKSAQIERNVFEIDGLSVYPNPVLNSATISFMPANDGRTTVDLYNALGQRLTRLMDRNVQKDIPINFQFNGQEYKEGLYILRVQNGNGSANTRIQIGR